MRYLLVSSEDSSVKIPIDVPEEMIKKNVNAGKHRAHDVKKATKIHRKKTQRARPLIFGKVKQTSKNRQVYKHTNKKKKRN